MTASSLTSLTAFQLSPVKKISDADYADKLVAIINSLYIFAFEMAVLTAPFCEDSIATQLALALAFFVFC